LKSKGKKEDEMTAQEHVVCLLLGSNIQPEMNLARATDLLQEIVTVKKVSSVWETPSIGQAGPNFLNFAMLITTPIDAGELKEKVLHPLEAQLGRIRSADKNAPRPIDIDIIIFDSHLIDPSLFNYAHRAVPVAEIMPDTPSEWGQPIREIACKMAETSAIRLRADVVINQKTLTR
jgi:2-amino-4-hydroxy-6-hydroxymethyldihydropteridine diphosphokinase